MPTNRRDRPQSDLSVKMKFGVVALATAVALLVGAVAALADPLPFDLAQVPPFLDAGAALGSTSGTGSTAGYSGTGACAGETAPEGYPHAAIYKGSASGVPALLELTVNDDENGPLSLCEVAIYRAKANDVSFVDPFDAAQRSALLFGRTTECSEASTCSLSKWLAAGEAFYVVLWSAVPPPDSTPETETPPPSDAAFSYAASVRHKTALAIGLSGHRIKDLCAQYHEVVYGRYLTVRADTSPNATGSVRFELKAWDGDSWNPAGSSTRTLSNGNASIRYKAGASGKRLITAKFLGNAVGLPATSATMRILYVTPPWTRYSDGGLRLKVPYYRQQRRLSCEGAALRMAHNYFHPGRIDYDTSVYKITGIDPRRPARNGGCNPDRAFCGNVDGLMMKDGYGVHYRPIALAATSYDKCRPGIALRTYSYATLAGYLDNGYPVVVWGAHKGSTGIHKYNWRAWDGSYVTAYSVEHTWTVVGFRGKPGSPTHFIVADPSKSSSGGVKTVTTSQYYAFTKYFKTAVVVRG
ncbi:MAG: C39 family peptidase [Actinomycetota bacterium]